MASHAGQRIHIGPRIIDMIDGIGLTSGHRLHMAANAIGDLDLVEGTAVECHMRGDSQSQLTDVHDRRIGRMTPDAGIVSGILRHAMHRMTHITPLGARDAMPHPCQAVTAQAGPILNKGLRVIDMLRGIGLPAH